MQTEWALCPRVTPGGEGGAGPVAALVLIGVFTRQRQILAQLVVTAAGEGREASASPLPRNCCDSAVTMQICSAVLVARDKRSGAHFHTYTLPYNK